MSTAIAWFVRGQKHAKLCEVSIAAARRACRHVEAIVATDDPEVTVPGAHMLRFECGEPLMVANIEAQLQVLWARRTPVWFIDTDVLLLKEPPDLHQEMILVTWRDSVGGKLRGEEHNLLSDLMPYNYGVMAVYPGARSIEAMLWLRERVRKMGGNLRDWYGNQIALAALAGPRPAGSEEGTLPMLQHDWRNIPWQLTDPGPKVLIGKLAGAVWNYTPAEPDEDLTGRGALHFKGHSRELMAGYVERLGLTWPEEVAA